MAREEPQGFSEFWSVWKPYARHTDGRGLARKTFEAHVRAGADPQDIVDGARCFFRTMKERDRDFVPLASTFLNRESYPELAIQEREHQQRIIEAQQRRAAEASNVVQMKPASDQIDPEVRARMVAEARARIGRSGS